MELELKKWRVCGYYNYTPILSKSMEMGVPLSGITDPMETEIPSSVYGTLIKHGLIEDPYFELNSQKAEWVSARWWIYETSFSVEKEDGIYELTFEGIDYYADIYLNGVKIAESANMFKPVTVNVTNLLAYGKDNQVKVCIHQAPDEMGQIGYTSRVFTQKSRFSYKWDFCPRLVGMGINGRVYLKRYETAKIFGADFKLSKNDDVQADISIITEKSGNAELEIIVENCGKVVLKESETVYLQEGETHLSRVLKIKNLRRWKVGVNNLGNLYDVRYLLKRDGKSDEYSVRTGFRTFELLPCDDAVADADPFVFCFNGERVFMRGVNITPLDMLYERIDDARYEKLISDLKEMNVNLIRVWGGGVIESETFYRLCDEYGIAVWQDFIQSSSGIDNDPSTDESYAKIFADTCQAAILRTRSHPSLCVYCGGNELASGEERRPLGMEHPIVKLAADYVRQNSDKAFLTTTPSGHNFENDPNHPEKNGDIHAPWLYLGTEEQYTYANNLRCLFHSEFGCNGMCSIESMRKFLSEKNIGTFDMRNNLVWRHHGEVWDTAFRDRAIFGDFENVEDMILASQYIQAEAIRYLLEADRRRAFAIGGDLIWQANELYPNVASTSLIDYYGERKLACYAVKEAYSDVYAGVVYDKLIYEKGEKIILTPFVSNLTDCADCVLNISITSAGETLYENETETALTVESGRATYLPELRFTANDDLLITLSVRTADGKSESKTNVIQFVKKQDGTCDLKTVRAWKNALKA